MTRDNSKYAPTGNKAIDLVAQAVGHSERFNKPIKFISLSRTYYALFMAGIEILSQEVLPNKHHLTFDGVSILQGGRGQWENLIIEYVTPQEQLKAVTQ